MGGPTAIRSQSAFSSVAASTCGWSLVALAALRHETGGTRWLPHPRWLFTLRAWCTAHFGVELSIQLKIAGGLAEMFLGYVCHGGVRVTSCVRLHACKSGTVWKEREVCWRRSVNVEGSSQPPSDHSQRQRAVR